MAGIDYSPLGKAIGRLNEGLEALQREPDNSLYRDAVIQRFEFTYGLCASMMKRRLAQTAAVEPDREMTFPALIRTASENGLLRSGGMSGSSSEKPGILPVTFTTKTRLGW
jgi:hypothetical protein